MAGMFSVIGRSSDGALALYGSIWEPLLPPLAWLGSMVPVSLFAGLAVIAAVFPSGAFPTGRIGRWTRVGLGLIAAIALLQAVAPDLSAPLPDGQTVTIVNPIGVAPDWSGWSLFEGAAPVPYLVALFGVVICVAGLLLRFRRSGGIERQQDKWLIASLALVAAAVAFGFIGTASVDPQGTWSWFPALLSFPLPPIGDRHRDHALPPLRDRPHHQSDHRLCRRDGHPVHDLRRREPHASIGARAGHRRRLRRGRRVDARRCRLVQPASWTAPACRRPTLQPCRAERGADRRSICRTPARSA